jgi:hypothetical protein
MSKLAALTAGSGITALLANGEHETLLDRSIFCVAISTIFWIYVKANEKKDKESRDREIKREEEGRKREEEGRMREIEGHAREQKLLNALNEYHEHREAVQTGILKETADSLNSLSASIAHNTAHLMQIPQAIKSLEERIKES